MQQGDVLNIQAELVDTTTESQLWGEQFRQKITDLLTVQEEIAWQISEALRLKLTGEQKKKLRKRATVNPEAYQEYLRGRYHWNSWSPDGFRRAGRTLRAGDRARSRVRAGLRGARRYLRRDGLLRVHPAGRGIPAGPGRGHAARWSSIPSSPDAHVTLALDLLFHGWDWAAAERELQQGDRARTRSSRPPTPSTRLFLGTAGRHDEALAEARLARELDPLSLLHQHERRPGRTTSPGEPEEAIREALRARELAPDLEEAGNILMASYDTWDGSRRPRI